MNTDFITFFFAGMCVGIFLAVGVWLIRVLFNFIRGVFSDSPVWENIV